MKILLAGALIAVGLCIASSGITAALNSDQSHFSSAETIATAPSLPQSTLTYQINLNPLETIKQAFMQVIDIVVNHQINTLQSAYLEEENCHLQAEIFVKREFVKRLGVERRRFHNFPWITGFIDELISKYRIG